MMKANDNKTIDDISSALILHERNVAPVSASSSSGEVLEARGTRGKFFRKTNKPPPNHSSEGDNKNSNLVCKYCGNKGHWLRQCSRWKADGEPPYPARAGGTSGRKPSATVSETDTKMALATVSSDVFSASTNDKWWVDNGATKHITNNFSWFTLYEPFVNKSTVTAAGKEVLRARGSGTIEVANYFKGKLETFSLNNVWYVPEISRNLFSVLAAHDRNPSSRFESNQHSCRFIVGSKIVFAGKREPFGTLYEASFHTVHPEDVCANVVENDQMLQLYHERWGHMDKRHVRNKLQSELGIEVKVNNDICESCQYGKAHRLSFGHRARTTAPGELLSGDVCGAFDPSFNGRRYLIVIKDHFSHYRYTFVSKEKNAVKDALRIVLAQARSLGHNVKEFLSDNGGEFDNGDVRALLQEYGVIQRLTAPYTPQQNGAVERENRTIVEMARTFKYSNPEVEFPSAIWAELVTTAGYVLNRLGKSSVENKSPYEVWLGQKPRIKHLRIVSSKCYVHVPDKKRRKMDSKAVSGYLVGYDGNERYRVYVPERHDIVLSRDVVFHEKIVDCTEKVSLPLPENKIENASDETEIENAQKETNDAHEDEDASSSQNESSESSSDSEDENAQQKAQSPSTRRGTRHRRPPPYLEDYATMAEAFILEDNPKTFAEAIQRPDCLEWEKAMGTEMESMREHRAWDLVELPKGKFAIKNRWVFRLKRNPDGSVDRYRARMVIQGCAQRAGVDYGEIFSPVTRLDTVRSLLAVAAVQRMKVMQFDVSTAFLYGAVDEEIYMHQPVGFEDDTNRVCRLNRSLYGLKQASRCWNQKFDKFMVSLGFMQSKEDPCVYIRHHKVIVALYVDDGLVVSTNQEELDNFLDELRSKFKIVAKELNYFLGLEISQSKNGDITVGQSAFVDKLLERFNMVGCKPVSTPIEKLTSSASGKENVTFPYRSAVGALLYLARGSRFDIAFAVSVLSRSLENPTVEDVGRVKRVFRYLAGRKDLKLVYRSEPESRVMSCYSDADFAGCQTTLRSTTGVVIMFADAAVCWLSRRQQLVSDSTCEAETIAANAASKEIVWLARLLKELINLSAIPVLQIDNQAAKRLSENPEFHFRTKHIQRKYLFIRDRIKKKMLEVCHVESDLQLADIFTKPLPRIRLLKLRHMLGLKSNI
ncbi:hypothetical protein V9T40_003620 [Parthenolecanium corni]|uniref:Uncharacterized protein n=1 Tax=Parthenolecanium corni TaxID=536013 RepID=A0AAN9Y919_9HEMI